MADSETPYHPDSEDLRRIPVDLFASKKLPGLSSGDLEFADSSDHLVFILRKSSSTLKSLLDSSGVPLYSISRLHNGMWELHKRDVEKHKELVLTRTKPETVVKEPETVVKEILMEFPTASNDLKQSSDAMLTIVDLAGAEREKRTGNQGERLVESNFINTTSMVFGQCLRALLEYQKNRRKGLQKHHQNSLVLARLSRREKEDGFGFGTIKA